MVEMFNYNKALLKSITKQRKEHCAFVRFLKKIFHVHKWKLLSKARGTANVGGLFFKGQMEGYIRLWVCTKCRKKEADFKAISGECIEVDVDYAEFYLAEKGISDRVAVKDPTDFSEDK